MGSPWRVGLAACCIGLLVTGIGSAYVLTGTDWSYQEAPMGENWVVCGTGVPGGGVQRTKDGVSPWNYPNFTFTFGADACASGGVYPSINGVNQVDFGAGLGRGVLAETTSWFFRSNPADTIECDMRFSSAVSWHTGTGTPLPTQFDWQTVALHEMGHCLGLDHETRITNPTPVMYPTLAAGEVRRQLTADDVAGRNAIYGAVGGPTTPLPGDYDGDGRADIALRYHQDSGWSILSSDTGEVQTVQFGWPALVPVPGDYDGDGKADLTVRDPQSSTWYIPFSSTGQLSVFPFGWSALVPVPGDYDGDGRTDIALLDLELATWYVQVSSTGQLLTPQFGWSGLAPVPGDYDGDGRTDVAVRDVQSSTWYIQESLTGQLRTVQFGWSVLVPVKGDYDGDGKMDVAARDPDSSTWYILLSSTGQLRATQFGWSALVPIPEDYDGDGRTDIALFDPQNSTWYILLSSTGQLRTIQFG
jgi:putative transposon-encoded protein